MRQYVLKEYRLDFYYLIGDGCTLWTLIYRRRKTNRITCNKPTLKNLHASNDLLFIQANVFLAI